MHLLCVVSAAHALSASDLDGVPTYLFPPQNVEPLKEHSYFSLHPQAYHNIWPIISTKGMFAERMNEKWMSHAEVPGRTKCFRTAVEFSLFL